MLLGSTLLPKPDPESSKNLFVCDFWGVRFRGRISEGILGDLCMWKPSETILKTMVLNVFRLFYILINKYSKIDTK